MPKYRNRSWIHNLLLVALHVTPLMAQSPGSGANELSSYLPESYFPELAGILETAIEQAPSLTEHAFLEDEAQARLEQAKAHGLPNANAYFLVGPREEFRSGDVEDNSYIALNGGVRLTQPLYHWGAIKAGIRQAELSLDDKELERIRQETELTRQVRSDYLQLLLNQEHQKKERSRLALSKEALKRIQIEYDSRKVAKIALQEKQLEVRQVELSIAKMEAYERVLRNRFRQKYGISERVTSQQPLLELDAAAARRWLEKEIARLDGSQVYDYIPVRRQLGLVEQQEAYLKVVEANNRPKLNLFFSGIQGTTNTAAENDVNTISLTAGLSINWNLFDGFSTQEQKVEARLKKNRLQYGLERRVRELRVEQDRMLKSLELRLREFELLSLGYALRQARHRDAEIRFGEGRMTEADLQRAQLDLDNLKTDLEQAFFDLLLGFSDYDAFTRMVAKG